MGEHLFFLGGVALAAVGAVLYWRSRKARVPLSPLEQVNRLSLTRELDLVKARWEELVRENELLAQEVARLGDKLDKKSDQLERLVDELPQRLRACTCGPGQEIAAELEAGIHG